MVEVPPHTHTQTLLSSQSVTVVTHERLEETDVMIVLHNEEISTLNDEDKPMILLYTSCASKGSSMASKLPFGLQ